MPFGTVLFGAKDGVSAEKQASKRACKVLQHAHFKVIAPLQPFICCHRSLKATLNKPQEQYTVN